MAARVYLSFETLTNLLLKFRKAQIMSALAVQIVHISLETLDTHPNPTLN